MGVRLGSRDVRSLGQVPLEVTVLEVLGVVEIGDERWERGAEDLLYGDTSYLGTSCMLVVVVMMDDLSCRCLLSKLQ